MGTVYSIKISNPPKDIDPKKLKPDIEAILTDVNSKMSTYLANSELSVFNGSISNDWHDVSKDLYRVVQEAWAISEKTAGAFDITVGPLINLWGFGPEQPMVERIPSDQQIQERLAYIGYKMITLRESPPGIKKKDPRVYVDLSALAKGYGVDLVADYLESVGVWDYLVEVGGEVRTRGVNAAGTRWRIAIEKPVGNARSIQRIISVGDAAIATSGDYRNYIERNGKRYSHTIDPRTGKPITHRLASVSVLSHTALHADAMATALMVLGPEDGMGLAEREGVAALFIIRTDQGFTEKSTNGFPREAET